MSARLRAAFLTLGLLAILLTGWQAYRIAYKALEDAAYARLTAIRETKKRQIEGYFRSIARTVETLAKGEVVTDAILGFEAALADANEQDYRAVESLYGETLAGYASAFGFEDLLLLDAAPLRALYSAKGAATPESALSKGSLAEVANRAIAAAGEAAIADFAPYPSEDGPAAAFAAAAVFEDGELIGLLAVQLSAYGIDQVMTGGGGWKEEGLGDSGETYLVGSDGFMRSDSRFFLEDAGVYFHQLQEYGFPKEALDRVRTVRSTVLTQEARTDAVARALRGEAHTSRVVDYRGLPVLSSFTPLDLPGLEWVLLSEIDEEEVFRPVRELRNRLFALALAVSAAYFAIGYWFSRRTTQPLLALAGEIDELRHKGLERRGRLSSFQNADDEVARLAESFHDLTERLRETTVSRDYLDNLLRSMLNAVFVVRETPAGPEIRSANEAARRMLKLGDGDIAGQPLRTILGSGESPPEWLLRLRKDGVLPPIEKTLVDAEGRRIPVLFTAALLQAGEEDVVCVAQDITQLKDAESRLRVLARQLISAQEEERSRLARELHDDITQRIGILAIEAGKLERSAPSDNEVRSQAAAIKERAILLSEDVHGLSRSLHPSIIEDLGLVAALRAECTALAKRLDRPVSFAAEDPPGSLGRDGRLALYRIAQECFHNIVRHAAATEVNVELSVWESRVELVIEDDGRGFIPAEARGRGGLGLASMEERARLAGGSLRIESTPGRGCKVTVELPIEVDQG